MGQKLTRRILLRIKKVGQSLGIRIRKKGNRAMKCKGISYTNSQISALIDEHIHNKRNREILKRHFVDGETYETIAAALELSPRRVASIVSDGAAHLAEFL